jgi:hypothetical protein
MSWNLLSRFIESDVFNQDPFLSVAYLSYELPRPFSLPCALAANVASQAVCGSRRDHLRPVLEVAMLQLRGD